MMMMMMMIKESKDTLTPPSYFREVKGA